MDRVRKASENYETSSKICDSTNDKEQVNHSSKNAQEIVSIINSYHSSILRIFSIITILLSILPQINTLSDPDCGINRFNNESPLTERIVGGNNSLQ